MFLTVCSTKQKTKTNKQKIESTKYYGTFVPFKSIRTQFSFVWVTVFSIRVMVFSIMSSCLGKVNVLPLRYYPTFKVRKFESLFYKLIYLCKKLPLALDSKQSKYFLYLFQFWAWLLRFLFNVISKSCSFLW